MTKLYLVRHIPSGQWLCGDYQLRMKPDYSRLTDSKPNIITYWQPHGWDCRGDEPLAEKKTFSLQGKSTHSFIECKPEEFEIVEFELTQNGY